MEITQLLTITVLVTSGFLATSLDNLLILVLLYGATRSRLAVMLGYLASTAIVMLLAALGYLLGGMLDADLVGYLGLIPLALGVYALLRPNKLLHANTDVEWGQSGFAGYFVTSFTLMLSNSGDSLALFLPLLADTGRAWFPFLFLVWLLAALAWASFAWLLGSKRALAELIERRGAKLIPWVMIGVGCYILMDTATDKFGA